MAKVIFEVPAPKNPRWKFWRKALDAVNTSYSNGYAFEGTFLPAGRKSELQAGSLVLAYDEVGSARYHAPEVALLQVSASGRLEPVRDEQGPVKAEGFSWALDLRDRVALLMGQEVQVDTAQELEPPLALLLRDVLVWGRESDMPEALQLRIREALGASAMARVRGVAP